MSVSTRIDVDVTGFKQGVDQARASLKTLDAALKTNEASFKAGGNAEIYMQQKTQLLNDKMSKQRELVNTLQAQMKKMRDAGVDPLSTDYQKLETQMLNAQTAMLETKTTIDELDNSQQQAASSAEKLTDGVGSIGKKMSLDQVISGIGRITEAAKGAIRQIIEFGGTVWGEIEKTAGTADDLATMAVMYSTDPETLQRQKKVFDTMADTSIEAYYNAKARVSSALNNPTKDQTEIFEALGLATPTYDSVNLLVKDSETALWAVGERLRARVESKEISQDQADTWSKALFGRGFMELNPLFAMGRTAFEEASGSMSAATNEAIDNGAKLNDSIILLQENFETLKLEVLGGIAPELTKVTNSISALINELIAYAQTDEGQALLKSMADSISSMFSDLANIKPEDVVANFKSIFDTLKEGFNWVTDHKDDIYNAIKYIARGLALLKVSETFLTFMKLGQGLAGLFGGGGAASSAAGAGGAGLTLQAIGQWATEKLGNITQHIPSTFSAWNAGFIGDWLWNNTLPGQTLRDTGDVGTTLKVSGDAVAKYITETLPKNFDDFVNRDSYWGKIISGAGGYFDSLKGTWGGFFADWQEKNSASSSRLFDPDQLQKEFESLFAGADPVQIPSEPVVEDDAAAKIAAEIGPVSVDVTPNINRNYWLSLTGGAGGGNRWASQHLHAAGLPWVPDNGYLAYLHRGERIMSAGENAEFVASAYQRARRAEAADAGSNRMINVSLMIGPERMAEVMIPLIDNGLGEIMAQTRR